MRIEHLDERRCCVARHDGPVTSVDDTRRPVYQHMISNELVGGASMLRFGETLRDEGPVDVLIGASCEFPGDDVVSVEMLPAGAYAVEDYMGPVIGIAAARRRFMERVEQEHRPVGRLLQVHLMDDIDGESEQQFQVRLDLDS